LIKTLSEVLERSEKELGSIIAEQEINQLNDKISSPLRWLEQALSKKDVPSIIQYQERVLEVIYSNSLPKKLVVDAS
jgi:hypothetical protein